MARRSLLFLTLVCSWLLAAVPGAHAQLRLPATGRADYRVAASLDPLQRAISGRAEITWTNQTARATSELRFHLYWNAWRNDRSTWMLANRGRDDGGDPPREGDWGWIEVDRLRLAGGAELARRHESPDDGNPEDRTVLVATLPAPVAPGASVRVEVEFHSKVPRTFARTGVRGDYYFVAHWFPKLGVFEGERGWNCHQFQAATEFYGDYGDYDVSLVLPERFVVGATGREIETKPGDGGTVTHRFTQKDVHGFTWTASPDFRVATDRFSEEPLPPVDLRLLYQPEHEDQVARHFDATKAALRTYGTWYGAYPYGHLTVVDPAWESGSGGMEYPTLFTSGSRYLNPFGGGSPEGVTIHEAGHQFWYGLVGNNEVEHAWLDEGLNTFSTERATVETYGPDLHVERYLKAPGTDWRAFMPWTFRDLPSNRLEMSGMGRYRQNGARDVPATPTFHYDPKSAASITYSKTAIWLLTLERYLGWDTLQPILSTFFQRGRLRHPEPADFFAAANEVAQARRGENLDWFFDQVYRGSAVFDYGVDRMSSVPAAAEGWVEKDGQLAYVERVGEPAAFRHEVVVRRYGDGIFPVEVLLVFADGSEVRERWDGRERWKLLVHEGPSKLARAVVDPDEILALDIDRTNNGRLAKPAGKLAATKWGSKWMLWLQDRLQAFASFV
jgi:hypothetical protein